LISFRSERRDETVVTKTHKVFIGAANRGYHPNAIILSEALFAIIFEDYLEQKQVDLQLEGIAKPTLLNALIVRTLDWGDYRNVLSHYELTFTPILRLKLYLELLHQTNITSDSLGQILRAVTGLFEMFRTDPNVKFVESVLGSKEGIVNSLPSESNPSSYSRLRYPSLKDIHTAATKQEEIIESLSWAEKNLSYKFARFEPDLEQSFKTTQELTDRILTSFGPDALTLFREIFERLTTHSPSQKIK
jgi:hypothetical protein